MANQPVRDAVSPDRNGSAGKRDKTENARVIAALDAWEPNWREIDQVLCR
jgi:hypothetical protein